MFTHIRDREQEIALLKFAKLEASYLRENIEEAKKLPPVLKKDGSIHKTAMKQRETIIKRWEKEVEKLRKFFNSHKTGGRPNDYTRYNYRAGVTDNRIGVENLAKSITGQRG
jgi:hypothetical protein